MLLALERFAGDDDVLAQPETIITSAHDQVAAVRPNQRPVIVNKRERWVEEFRRGRKGWDAIWPSN